MNDEDLKLFNESIQEAMKPEEKRLMDSISIVPEFLKGQVSPALSGQPVEPKDKGGRPKGFDGRKAKMPSAMAQKFKQAGLDWQVDFANAIKRASNYDLTKADRNEARERISLWLRLLPYLITTSARSSNKKWKGKPSKAALIALEKLEDRGD